MPEGKKKQRLPRKLKKKILRFLDHSKNRVWGLEKAKELFYHFTIWGRYLPRGSLDWHIRKYADGKQDIEKYKQQILGTWDNDKPKTDQRLITTSAQKKNTE